MKPDDHLDDAQQLLRIRHEAEQALRDADALGVFPTPVDRIIEAAQHTIVPDQTIDKGFLAKASRKVGGLVKQALSKVLGVLDVAARTMHLDAGVHVAKLPFLKLHELGHGVLLWQREAYSLAADCEYTLDPDISDLFERESNTFASEVLFQLDGFAGEAADQDFSIKTPLKLSKRYGASVYATVRRFVRTNQRACVVVVLEKPQLNAGHGFVADVRRVVASPEFERRFGKAAWPRKITPDSAIGRAVPIGRKLSRPRVVQLVDDNGISHECVAEGFDSGYQVFILVCPVEALTRVSVLVPS